MKSLIFLGLICACAAFPQYIADTPEVHAEKQRFFQMFNAHAAAAAAAPDTDIHYGPTQHHYSKPAAPVHRFAVPQHQPATPYHNNPQYNHAPQYHPAPPQPKWTGPLAATVPAGLPGSVAQVPNTPEVDAAIADFGRAYSAAVVATRSTGPQNYYQPANQGHYNPSYQRW